MSVPYLDGQKAGILAETGKILSCELHIVRMNGMFDRNFQDGYRTVVNNVTLIQDQISRFFGKTRVIIKSPDQYVRIQKNIHIVPPNIPAISSLY